MKKHQSVKNKFAKANEAMLAMSVSAYVTRNTERQLAPGRLINGEMQVLYDGRYISQREFDRLLPPAIVFDFNARKDNSDKSKSWML